MRIVGGNMNENEKKQLVYANDADDLLEFGADLMDEDSETIQVFDFSGQEVET